MTPPIQLQRMPKRKTMKPATVRALFWYVATACFAVGCLGLIARCAPLHHWSAPQERSRWTTSVRKALPDAPAPDTTTP